MKFTQINYCQYLLSSQRNYTLTNFASHIKKWSHDTINRYLRNQKLTPRIVWSNLKNIIVTSPTGYLIFDDTVLDKRFSPKNEIAFRQYSGNQHRVIQGIGVVNCVYVNPENNEFWIIDYRIYNPVEDGKSKLAHVEDMLNHAYYQKQLPFKTVLMDSWYATTYLMKFIDKLGKIYYCPLKKNRLVDESEGTKLYQRIENLIWSKSEVKKGKIVKIKKFPQNKQVKLFRVEVSTDRTEFIATNDDAQLTTNDIQIVCAIRWKVEEFHRELKQVTGIEKCQCRQSRIQRNHINCAILVWLRLKHLAYQTGQTIYELKQGLLDDYLTEELLKPSIAMTLVHV